MSPPELKAATSATFAVFFLNGATFATWASRIPDVRDALALTPGQLGMLLLAMSAGSITGLPSAGLVAARHGAARTVLVGAVVCLTGLAVAGVAAGPARSAVAAAAALFAVGLGIGQWDVAMNLHAATVEGHLGRTVMPRFHAAFSVGTVAGATGGAALSAAALPLAAHFVAAAVALLAATAYAAARFLPHQPHRESTPAGRRRDALGAWGDRRTLVVGLVTLVAAFAEGSANDWLSVAFVDAHGLPTWAGVLGFAVFLAFMTAGRVLGPSLLDRHGRVPVMRTLFVVAGAGSLLVAFGSAPLAFLGAAIWGFGISLAFPVGISAAADDPAAAPARVAVVSTIGYAAFLAGPPLLGFLGDHWGVSRALAVVSLTLAAAFLALPALAPRDAAGPPRR